MNPILREFILESRESLQGIGSTLLALESSPSDPGLIQELFRLVHTLKGNSGLFDFPQMTQLLHAAEDLMDAVREEQIPFTPELADQLLDAMDVVVLLVDEIENTEQLSSHYPAAVEQMTRLRECLSGAASDQNPPAGQAPAVIGGLFDDNATVFVSAGSESDAAAVESLDAVDSVAAVESTAAAQEVSDVACRQDHLSDVISAEVAQRIPESVQQNIWRELQQGRDFWWVLYRPEPDCFFKGEDPFYQVRQTPSCRWQAILQSDRWQDNDPDFDCYRCQVEFIQLCAGEEAPLREHFRYVPEQVVILPVSEADLLMPGGDADENGQHMAFVRDAQATLQCGDIKGLAEQGYGLLEKLSPDLWRASVLRWLLLVTEVAPSRTRLMGDLLASLEAGELLRPSLQESRPSGANEAGACTRLSAEQQGFIRELIEAQCRVLACEATATWANGRLESVMSSVHGLFLSMGNMPESLNHLLAGHRDAALASELKAWLENWLAAQPELPDDSSTAAPALITEEPSMPSSAEYAASPVSYEVEAAPLLNISNEPAAEIAVNALEQTPQEMPAPATARNEDHSVKVLKVDQSKVDRLMNLIGEMVVAKNALPYLANRAENHFGVRELSREIKAQYAVINRIAEEMQDAIMQVRMLPVSFIFQRFPRLVRDIARKLGKDVNLVLEGEDTEADKNIVESLADPLIHIVRNSLDHGLETAEQRTAAGKSARGTLLIRARQDSDRVLIDIIDDGRGIDPQVIKRKAYESGVIDEAQLERLTDSEAIQLIFAAGFSTAAAISDISGRGVGMDVVRTAVEKVGGTVTLSSEIGKGTTLRLSLPLSMAITNVMIIESHQQIFGVPMDQVVETVRLPRASLRDIKQRAVTTLRGRLLPVLALNDLLAIPAAPVANEEDELAALVVRIGNEQVALLVDEFREVVDVILKPLPGDLSRLSCYSGTALLGDGSVLMVLNPKELL
ncbi:chemotaxis protein CheW [Pokkaliibacter sp. CJK22405]|uniref:chemotaxis protein CheA n=1 Tax=Pokkaliibacter sp. CJK22405 TaxID=3384615 RepID=UPI0039850A63